MVCYPKRVFKNEDIDIAINVPEDEVNEFSLYILTDKETKVEVPLSAVTDGVVHFEPGDLDLLNDGIIRYELSYSVGDNDYAENTNTNLILKTPSTYSAKTAEDWYNEGYEAGLNDCSGETPDCSEAYQSGYTEGVSEQKAKLTGLTANTNMIYERTDGYDRVVVNVPTGYSQSDLDNAHTEGYNEGLAACSGDCEGVYESGYTEGFEDGYASGQTDCSGYTQADLDAAFQSGWTGGYNSGYSAGQSDCSGETPSSGDTPSSGETSGYTPDYTPRSGSTVNDYFGIEVIKTKKSLFETVAPKLRFVNDTNFLALQVEYRINGGSWQTLYSDSQETALSTLYLTDGDYIEFRGDNASYEGNKFVILDLDYSAVRGNIMSLVDSTGFATATTLGDRAFKYFLNGEIHDAGDLLLPATTLGSSTYSGLFMGTEIQYPPSVLPATDLSGTTDVYSEMFLYTPITKGPEIMATTLGIGSFAWMFKDCSALEASPVLRAATIAPQAYIGMFENCENLKEVTCLATSIDSVNPGSGYAYSTSLWLEGTSTYGTFTKAATMNDWTRDTNGIPINWTVVDAS